RHPRTVRGCRPVDVAHADGSLFQAATRGFLAAVSNVIVVQLHGFSAGEGRGRVVISNGERRTENAFLSRVQSALAQVVGDGVLRYPVDTSELGATTNVQG